MYEHYFGLTALPFSIAPDPRYLYMSNQHREALAHLIYGIRSNGGFVLLTGEVGSGKTTVCRCLLEQVPDGTDIAFIMNPKVTVEELLASFCDELGIGYPDGNRSVKVFVDRINAYLLDAHARGRKTVLIIEEAQNLSPEVLEEVRLLTNLETNERKLLQIIMVGQPELRETLSRPELLQLAQRVTARYHLEPLSQEDVAAYISHRLTISGARTALFPPQVMKEVHRLSGGIPRVINLICDRALLGAYTEGKSQVDSRILAKASQETLGKSSIPVSRTKVLGWGIVSLFLIIFVITAAYYSQRPLSAVTRQQDPLQLVALQWPSEKPIDRSRPLAFAALFNVWNIAYDQSETDICRQAETQGLRCLQGPGSLSSLSSLNRPAVLKLYDDGGRDFYALLTSLQGDIGQFIVGSETKTVALSEIEKRWYGEYILLWQPPSGFRTDIQPGSSDAAVQWVDSQLALIQNREKILGDSETYTNPLAKQVKKFQLNRGLVPDGIIGAQTMIHLANAAGTREPKLTEGPKRR